MNSFDNMISILEKDRTPKNQFIYIIGNNGSGKSTYLSGCVDNFKGDFNKIIGLPCGVFDRFSPKSKDNYYYCGFKANTNAVFLSAISKYITLLILNLISKKKISFLEKVLVDMELDLIFESAATLWDKRIPIKRRTNDEDKIKSKNAIDRYRNINDWRELSADDASTLEGSISKDLKFSARFRPIKSEVEHFSAENLSSGYLQKLHMVLSVAKEAENNCLILIDEPEISLHVKWQAELPKLFRQAISELTNCVVIVATHSPVIVSNSTLEDDYIYMIPNGETVESHNVDGNIETLLFEQFGYLPLDSHVISEMCADFIHRVTRQPSLAPRYKKHLADLKKSFPLSASDKKFIEKTLGVIEIVEQTKD